MSKIRAYAIQFNSMENNAEEIMVKLGAIISTERRPFGDTFLHTSGALPRRINHGDWIVKTEYGHEVISEKHFAEKFEAVPFTQKKDKELNSQIENNFSYHAPKEGQPQKYEKIRDTAKDLAYLFDELSPDNSREKSLAMTKLEEAVFWINASIARNE